MIPDESPPTDASVIDPAVRESLRCMRWDEAMTMSAAGHWLGAHTRSHAILSQVEPARRRDEIEGSVAALRERLGTHDVPFAYPHGQPCDFGPQDMAVLHELDVPLVCTTVAGGNRPPIDWLNLRRNGIGLFHTRRSFVAEALGLVDRRRRTQAERAACH
jgi:peptidoglycan/xylan/chitin deacetylase (PgdA/CDA1 family)